MNKTTWATLALPFKILVWAGVALVVGLVLGTLGLMLR